MNILGPKEGLQNSLQKFPSNTEILALLLFNVILTHNIMNMSLTLTFFLVKIFNLKKNPTHRITFDSWRVLVLRGIIMVHFVATCVHVWR